MECHEQSVSRFTLSNGLRVVHEYDPSTAMVCVNVLYDVGARDESAGRTGLAHLLEHLMFGGSVNIPDFDNCIESAGGGNNAWTSNDFTNFYDYAPAVNLDTLLWLESDRMIGPAFSPRTFEIQRSVVIEEFKQTHLNRPYGDVSHLLRSLVYTRHPYRVPTIGDSPEEVGSLTLDDVRSFFYSHYAPNNAVLSICGNVKPEEAREKVERWFGDIERRDIAPRLYLPEPAVVSPRELTVRRNCPQALVVVAFLMPGYGMRGYVECDLITDILASGRSSRYYRNLLMGDPLFTEAESSITGSEDPGFLMLRARLSDASDVAVERAIAMLTESAMALHHPESMAFPNGVGATELMRAVNRYDSNVQFGQLSYIQRAQEHALDELHGDSLASRLEAYRSVSFGDICATARQVIDPGRACTLVYRPE